MMIAYTHRRVTEPQVRAKLVAFIDHIVGQMLEVDTIEPWGSVAHRRRECCNRPTRQATNRGVLTLNRAAGIVAIETFVTQLGPTRCLSASVAPVTGAL